MDSAGLVEKAAMVARHTEDLEVWAVMAAMLALLATAATGSANGGHSGFDGFGLNAGIAGSTVAMADQLMAAMAARQTEDLGARPTEATVD